MKEILLVEDLDSDAELIQTALKVAGAANPVRRLINGEQAMAYLIQAEEAAAIGPPVPSILLLDLKLPGISGFEILERLRDRQAFAKMLRIVFSQFGDSNSIRRAYSLGAHSFLSKPVQSADLRGLFEMFPGYWTFDVSLKNIPTMPSDRPGDSAADDGRLTP